MTDLAGDRYWLERDLPDSGTIYRDTGAPAVWDEELGESVYPADQAIWQGPVSVAAAGVQARRTEPGGDPTVESTRTLRLPLSAPAEVGYVLVLDGIGPDGDPALLRRAFRFDEVSQRSRAGLRRVRATITKRTSA